MIDSLFRKEESLLETLNQLSCLLNQPSHHLNHSQLQISTTQISNIFDQISSEEELAQSAVNLIYIQSFYNISQQRMIEVSSEQFPYQVPRI